MVRKLLVAPFLLIHWGRNRTVAWLPFGLWPLSCAETLLFCTNCELKVFQKTRALGKMTSETVGAKVTFNWAWAPPLIRAQCTRILPPRSEKPAIMWLIAYRNALFFRRKEKRETILLCTSWIFPAGSDSKWPPDIPPRFLLGQKRRKHIQEALVKETVLKKGLN